MKNEMLPNPTDAELTLLGVLWKHGPSTVRQIHEQLADQKETGYTTTLKILQNMTDKGLVRRDESKRSHVYQAAIAAVETQRNLVLDLVRRAFGGSPKDLVVQALSTEQATQAELAEIRRIVDELESKQRKGRRK